MYRPTAASSSDRVSAGAVTGRPWLPGGMCPGRVGSSSVVIVPNSRSTFPLPRGRPGVLWISCTFRSAQTRVRWVLVKSAPWSL